MHKHKAVQEKTVSYRGTAQGARENRRAHGGVCYVAMCQCGARRETNSNAGAIERGAWICEDSEEK